MIDVKDWTYVPKTQEQLKSWYDGKVKSGVIQFKIFEHFKDWYKSKPKHCHYCGLTEEQCQFIVHSGILKFKRFPLHGEFRRGVNRGYWLEIDRKIPNGEYSAENCELCCYFCNNDKSDIFSDSQYIEFRSDRTLFFKKLIIEYETNLV